MFVERPEEKLQGKEFEVNMDHDDDLSAFFEGEERYLE